MAEKKRVTEDMLIADVVNLDEGLIPILLNAGLHCLGCPASQMEAIGEAGDVHGIDVQALIEDLNAYLEEQEK